MDRLSPAVVDAGRSLWSQVSTFLELMLLPWRLWQLLGIVLLAILQNGLNLLGVSSYFFQIVIGVTILVSTSVTVLSARRGRRQRTLDAAPVAPGAAHG